jgi:hypothetical protein
VSRDRPWRAVAYYPLPEGGRIVVKRTARATEDALTPWREAWERQGYRVDHWQVQPLPGVEAALP